MDKKQVRRMVDNALDELATDLEKGKSQKLMTYLATMARFPRYSYGNVFVALAV